MVVLPDLVADEEKISVPIIQDGDGERVRVTGEYEEKLGLEWFRQDLYPCLLKIVAGKEEDAGADARFLSLRMLEAVLGGIDPGCDREIVRASWDLCIDGSVALDSDLGSEAIGIVARWAFEKECVDSEKVFNVLSRELRSSNQAKKRRAQEVFGMLKQHVAL